MPSSVIPDSHRDLLEKPILAHVATIGPNGEPQSNPIWFLWDGKHIVFAVGPEGQKARNLGRDPRIAISMADPDNPIHYLELRGTTSGPRMCGSDDPALIAVVRKYTGADTYDGMPNEHAMYAMNVTRTTSMG